jgi:hypothetical protein
MMPDTLRVVAAALRFGVIYSMPAPARHHHILSEMNMAGISREIILKAEQGFLLSNGLFVHRYYAKQVAVEAGQLKGETPHKELFSEDVW